MKTAELNLLKEIIAIDNKIAKETNNKIYYYDSIMTFVEECQYTSCIIYLKKFHKDLKHVDLCFTKIISGYENVQRYEINETFSKFIRIIRKMDIKLNKKWILNSIKHTITLMMVKLKKAGEYL